LLNNIRCLLLCFTCLLVITGCATKAIKNEAKCLKIDDISAQSFLGFYPSDTDIFMNALNCLGNQDKDENFQTAKEQLEELVQKYPKSKWKYSAQGLITIIRNLTELKASIATERQKNETEKSNLNKEIMELKNDIQRLKNLEIQLDQREKKFK